MSYIQTAWIKNETGCSIHNILINNQRQYVMALIRLLCLIFEEASGLFTWQTNEKSKWKHTRNLSVICVYTELWQIINGWTQLKSIPFFRLALTVELGSWSPPPYCQHSGVRIAIVTAHTDSPMYVSKMDSGVSASYGSERLLHMQVLDNTSHWPPTLIHCFLWFVHHNW